MSAYCEPKNATRSQFELQLMKKHPIMPILLLDFALVERMDCYQTSEKSKRISCSWTAVSESLEYTAFLLDGRENVVEKIRVNEPRCSFHGRLLKFGETYNVEVGGFRRSVGLMGTLVLRDVTIFLQ